MEKRIRTSRAFAEVEDEESLWSLQQRIESTVRKIRTLRTEREQLASSLEELNAEMTHLDQLAAEEARKTADEETRRKEVPEEPSH